MLIMVASAPTATSYHLGFPGGAQASAEAACWADDPKTTWSARAWYDMEAWVVDLDRHYFLFVKGRANAAGEEVQYSELITHANTGNQREMWIVHGTGIVEAMIGDSAWAQAEAESWGTLAGSHHSAPETGAAFDECNDDDLEPCEALVRVLFGDETPPSALLLIFGALGCAT